MIRMTMMLAMVTSLFAMSQEEQNEIWRKALADSEKAKQESSQPAEPPQRGADRSSPSYQKALAEEPERLRQQQEQWRAEREARERAAADEKARLQAVAIEEWNEEQRKLAEERRKARESEAIREQARATAEKQERADRAVRERWHTVWFIIAGIVGLIVLALPSVIASFRRSPQRPAIDGLVVCSLLSALAVGQQPAAAPAPVLLWSADLALSLWRFRSP